MARKIKFDFEEETTIGGGVHFVSELNDYTLCGLSLDGDTGTTGAFKATKQKVNCKHCIEIIEYCKKIKKTEYKTQ